MQNRHENSNPNAQRAAVLTTGPGNGLSTQPLRNDVIKVRDWTFEDYNHVPITENPVKHLYKVQSDCMLPRNVWEFREMVLMNDELKAEVIPLEMLVPGKLYIITDHGGNVYLSRIKEFNPGQSLQLKFLNPKFPDVILRRNDIAAVAMCYERSTQVMSNHDLDDLCREYPFDGKDLSND